MIEPPKNEALEPAPLLGSPEPRVDLGYFPELLRQGSPVCFCTRCGNYFADEPAFTAHQLRHGVCAADERELRAAGLKTKKRHEIRGQVVIEWRLAR